MEGTRRRDEIQEQNISVNKIKIFYVPLYKPTFETDEILL